MRKLPRYLKSIGITTRLRKQFSQNTIMKILKNPAYAGDFAWNKTFFEKIEGKKRTFENEPERWIVIKDHHEPIISRPIFDAVQEKIKNRSGKLTKHNNAEYLFTNLIHFTPCDMTLEGWCKTRDNGVVERYYRCNRWKRGRDIETEYCKECKVKSIRQEIIEPFLIMQMKKLKNKLPEIKRIVDEVKRETGPDLENLIRNEKSLYSNLQILEGQEKTLIEQFKESKIDKKNFAEKFEIISSKQNKIGAELNNIRVERSNQQLAEADTNFTKDIIERFDDYFEAADINEKKNLIGAIFKQVKIGHDGKVEIIFRLPIGKFEAHVEPKLMAA